ncbi:MAG TPA: hypothetical protein VHM24_08110 [Gemmatimonadaceae bacterium]|nr:hypothetical protein [Gemmatimonadaceae bacterium]
MADRWLIQYGTEKDSLRIIGKASTRGQAASIAQGHFDSNCAEDKDARVVFDPENPAGEYQCSKGWYRITRLGSGQWAVIRDS